MRHERMLVAVALVGVVALVTGCEDKVARAAAAKAQADVDAVTAKVTIIDKYLTDLYPWLLLSANATCQLEKNNPGGLDPNLRICPGSPPDLKPPPKYPPS